jgi:hypothetical protein
VNKRQPLGRALLFYSFSQRRRRVPQLVINADVEQDSQRTSFANQAITPCRPIIGDDPLAQNQQD